MGRDRGRHGWVSLEELIAAGVPMNVTLLFSDRHYLAVAAAYLRGLERRVREGRPPDVTSVMSLFISRWDRAADPLPPPELHGHVAVAVMQLVLAARRELLCSPRWTALAEAGARPQRLLCGCGRVYTATRPEVPRGAGDRRTGPRA